MDAAWKAVPAMHPVWQQLLWRYSREGRIIAEQYTDYSAKLKHTGILGRMGSGACEPAVATTMKRQL
jgi:hypothetical protein